MAAAAEAIGFADAEMSECLAQALVDGIGMDRIEASGLSPEEFTASPLGDTDVALDADEASDVQESMTDCGDLVDVYLDTLDITEAEADCASAALDQRAAGGVARDADLRAAVQRRARRRRRGGRRLRRRLTVPAR